MGIFDRMKEPIFLKDDSDARIQLDSLKELYKTAPDNIRFQIDQDMKLLSYGIAGEEQIAFELRNSHIPMYILHDLFLEVDGLTAQIDYLVITKNGILVIECKNLIGNIEINNAGDFVRTIEVNHKTKKEGIYSPVTQNIRHMELIRQLRLKTKGNFLAKAVFDKNFYSTYHSIVVLANPKTVLNAKYAKKEIKEQVIRADQLIAHIKKINSEHGIMDSLSDKDMEELAQFFLNQHKSNPTNYLKKYSVESETPNKQQEVYSALNAPIKDEVVYDFNVIETAPKQDRMTVENSLTDSKEVIIKELKSYRLIKSREENIKPYYIFNDKQMMEIIARMPETKEQLIGIGGFNDSKYHKYGYAIIDILNKKEEY